MTERAIRIHHTGFTVSDLQRSVDFYRRFGFQEEARGEASGPDVEIGTGIPSAVLREAMLVRDGVRLELIEYALPSGGPPPLPPNGIGAAHVAIEVDDIDSAVNGLRDAGVTFISDPITTGDLRWVYFKDPDGITAELIQVLR
jgi:catechol 2,3-dioxygenase-like lactoylglutathione lyase family enzyme